MGELNWTDWLLGGAVGLLLPYLVDTISYLVRRFRKERFEGKWFAYHPIELPNGECVIEPSLVHIKKGYQKGYLAIETREGFSGPVYKGTFKRERDFWLLQLKATQDVEEVMIRLYAPIPQADRITYGLYLGIGFNRKPTSGPILLSRAPLSQELVTQRLVEYSEILMGHRLLTANFEPSS